VANFGHEGDRLSAFLDDELGERDALAVTRHLARCEDCRDELEDLRSTRAALRSLPQVEPSLAWMVETAVLGPGDARRSRLAPAVLAAAAVVLALVGTAFALGGDDSGSVRPAVEQLVVDHVRSVDAGPVVVPVRLETAP
jgi:anti-sigma factor RsiW